MKVWSFPTAALLALVLLPSSRGDDVDREKEKLQGTWVGVSGESIGLPYSKEDVSKLTVVISGDKMVFKWFKEVNFSFTLGASDTHKTIDRTVLDGVNKGNLSLGICTCEDNLLLLCVNSTGGKERPKSFATFRDPRRAFSMFLLRRVEQ